MLQQTQVATVIPYFHRFIERFPTIKSLADAPEQDVLRLWQGLGYYSRARNLQRASQAIMETHGGIVPHEVAELLKLPGIGPYTAGAIASLAYDKAAPILDGNVMRVICRIDAIRENPREKRTLARLWDRAKKILPGKRCGDFNSALMELGATVCTPKHPQCLICPVRQHCEAARLNLQEQIPLPKKSRPTPLLRRTVLCLRHQGRYLIEQRPAKGRWAGMWQFISREANGSALALARRFATPTGKARKLGIVKHALTHRRYEFAAWEMEVQPFDDEGNWVSLPQLSDYPLPVPHLRIAQLLSIGQTTG